MGGAAGSGLSEVCGRSEQRVGRQPGGSQYTGCSISKYYIIKQQESPYSHLGGIVFSPSFYNFQEDLLFVLSPVKPISDKIASAFTCDTLGKLV